MGCLGLTEMGFMVRTFVGSPVAAVAAYAGLNMAADARRTCRATLLTFYSLRIITVFKAK